ncbi:MAG: DUF4430 domain-containing protein [Clostridiales Family XIII bacterium]|jgi:hypothetical protein|nr:DUF4430 domain-containing protein [Clostridiales Family XIII bacterium]
MRFLHFLQSKIFLGIALSVAVLVGAYCLLPGGSASAEGQAAASDGKTVYAKDGKASLASESKADEAEDQADVSSPSAVSDPEQPASSGAVTGSGGSVGTQGSSDPVSGGNASAPAAPGGSTAQSGNGGAPAPAPAPVDRAPEPPKTLTVTIQIDCATILNNIGNLTPGKEGLVPANGVIMGARKVRFTEGETVFDVLKRETAKSGLHMEFSMSPIYGSAYIEGINNLYEFDCGELSGWMYNVNGWYPNYGCTQYTLKNGDTIQWRYTCNLGADLGASAALGGQ